MQSFRAQALLILSSTSLLFLGLIIGTLISELCFSGRLSDWLVNQQARRKGGLRVPEVRLVLSYPSACLTAVGLVVWGISVDRGWHWAVGQIALAICKLAAGWGHPGAILTSTDNF